MSNATTIKCYSCTAQYDPLDEQQSEDHARHLGSEAMSRIDRMHPHERLEALKRMIDNLQLERDKAIREAYYKEPHMKDKNTDQDQSLRAEALSHSVSMYRYDNRKDEIVKTAQKFYEFLKGETDE